MSSALCTVCKAQSNIEQSIARFPHRVRCKTPGFEHGSILHEAEMQCLLASSSLCLYRRHHQLCQQHHQHQSHHRHHHQTITVIVVIIILVFIIIIAINIIIAIPTNSPLARYETVLFKKKMTTGHSERRLIVRMFTTVPISFNSTNQRLINSQGQPVLSSASLG